MIVTIHQPEHMPWSGFFHKMACADLYVLLDHVQYKKDNYQNRNRLVDRRGEIFWCTVPLSAGSYQETISQKRIAEDSSWRRKYLNKLADSYRSSPYFDNYYDPVANIINRGHEFLVDMNLDLIDWFRAELAIDTPMIRSSTLVVQGLKSDLNLDICRQMKATSYLSGPSGKDYLDQQSFVDAGIKLDFHRFSPPVYPAQHFHPGLSMLDVLMNCGPGSRAVIGLDESARAGSPQQHG